MTRKYIKHDGKRVGYIEDNSYYTRRDEDTIFRKEKSINISQGVIEKLKQHDIKGVNFILEQKGKETMYYRELREIENYDTYTHKGDKQYMVPILDLKWNRRNFPQANLDYFFDKYKEAEANE